MANGLGLVDKPHLQRFKNNLDLILENKINTDDYATTSKFGIVKPDGTTITIDEQGRLVGSSGYELPTASSVTLGGVKVDDQTIVVDADGVISSTAKGGVDYLEEEQMLGIKWINEAEIYQTSFLFDEPIVCTANQWNEICSITSWAEILVDCAVTNNNNFVSHPDCKIEDDILYIYPNMNYSVTNLTVQYTKMAVPEFMNDVTWEVANQWMWEELENTKWKH